MPANSVPTALKIWILNQLSQKCDFIQQMPIAPCLISHNRCSLDRYLLMFAFLESKAVLSFFAAI
jgi:hypothetical protein